MSLRAGGLLTGGVERSVEVIVCSYQPSAARSRAATSSLSSSVQIAISVTASPDEMSIACMFFSNEDACLDVTEDRRRKRRERTLRSDLDGRGRRDKVRSSGGGSFGKGNDGDSGTGWCTEAQVRKDSHEGCQDVLHSQEIHCLPEHESARSGRTGASYIKCAKLLTYRGALRVVVERSCTKEKAMTVERDQVLG